MSYDIRGKGIYRAKCRCYDEAIDDVFNPRSIRGQEELAKWLREHWGHEFEIKVIWGGGRRHGGF